MKKYLFCLFFFGHILSLPAQDQPDTVKISFPTPIEINGVFPNLTIVAPHEDRSESGIGALLPWADRLWMIGYVAHISGSGIGLYEISEDMTMKKHISYTYHVLQDGFNAHWVRIVSENAGILTATFIYQ